MRSCHLWLAELPRDGLAERLVSPPELRLQKPLQLARHRLARR